MAGRLAPLTGMPHRSFYMLALAACAGDTRVASTAEIVVMSATTPAPPGGGTPSDLFVMNLDGSHREQLTHDDELEFLPHFSPDATSVVYTKFETGTYGTPGARTDIAIYDFATARERLLTHTGDAAQAAWSPDGSRIAYLRHTAATSSLWLMDADGGNARLVGSSTGAPDDAVWGDIAWSSDDWIMSHQRELGLDAKTRDRMVAEIQSFQTTAVKLQWDLDAAGAELAKQLGSPHVDEAAALAAADKVMQLEHDLKRAHLQLLVRLKNELTPAQQTRLRDAMAHR
jgi:Spy/CpxP family protein refolding chaperone